MFIVLLFSLNSMIVVFYHQLFQFVFFFLFSNQLFFDVLDLFFCLKCAKRFRYIFV